MMPKPTESVKKIWPAAASQSSGLASGRQMLSPSALGFHMKPSALLMFASGRVGSGVFSVSTRTRISTPISSSSGMANLQNASIPFVMPR